MAIIAKDGFSQAEFYYSVHNYTVHPKTRAVSARLNVFRNAEAAAAFKDAEAAIAAAQQTNKSKAAERLALHEKFLAQSDADKVKSLKTFQADTAKLDEAIKDAVQEEKLQESIRAASAPNPSLAKDEHFKPGEVPVSDKGAVTLDDIYIALHKGALAGGKKA